MTGKQKRGRGRPRKEVSGINLVRQVGRWSDEDWDEIRRAAKASGMDCAKWCKSILIPAAKKVLKRS